MQKKSKAKKAEQNKKKQAGKTAIDKLRINIQTVFEQAGFSYILRDECEMVTLHNREPDSN